jgi:hypothetical protein
MREEIRTFVAQLKMKNEKCKMNGGGQLKIENEKCKMNGATPVGSLTEGEGLNAHGAINVTENGDVTGLDKWAVWKALKASRKYPEFCWNSWARALGFASYRRLYRACMCVYDQTPHQMIMELIEEALREGEAEGTHETNAADGFKEWSLEELETELRGVKPFAIVV